MERSGQAVEVCLLHRDNPAFIGYAELLEQLQVLIDKGLGESIEADSIRDRMDEPWRHMTKEEIAEIDRSSAESREGCEDGRKRDFTHSGILKQ